MSPMIFAVAFAVGAAALALWTDARFPRLFPEEIRAILFHTVAAFAVLQLVNSLVGPFIAAGFASAVATLIGIALPGLTYALLVCIWAIKMFQGAHAGMRP